MGIIFSRERSLEEILVLGAAGIGITLGLLFLGWMAAVLPSLVVRFVPFALLAVVMLMAGFFRQSDGISERVSQRWLTLLVVIFVLWPSYMIFKFGSMPAIDGRKIVAAFSLLALFYLAINRKAIWAAMKGGEDRATRIVCKIILAYVLWRVLSGLFSPAPVESLLSVLWDVLYYYGIFFLAVSTLQTPGAVNRYVRVFLWLVIALALFAIVERVLGRNPLLEFAPRSDGLEDFAAALQITRFRDGVFRSQGTFEHPLLLAEFASIGACFGLAYALWGGVSGRLVGWLAFVAGVSALVLSGSRSGYLAAGGAITIVAWLWFLRPTKQLSAHASSLRVVTFLGGLVLALALSVPLLTAMAQGKTVSESTSTDARRVMLERGWPSIQANPLVGKGPGAAVSVAGIRTGSGIWTLDNYLLALTIDSGLPALLLFLASLLYPAWRATSFVLSRPSEYAPFAAAAVGSIFAVIVMRSFLWMPYNLSLVFIMIGLLLFVMRPTRSDESRVAAG